jgi:hypothetical protein
LILLGATLSWGTVTAATGARSIPPSLVLPLESSETVEQLVMPSPDVAAAIAEDRAMAAEGDPHMPRFATAIPTILGPHNAGSWQRLADGSRLWRLRISSPGALNLNLHFGRFSLPPGAALWIHDTGGGQIRGPYTFHDRNGAGELWTPVVLGDEVELEMLVPAGADGEVDVAIASVNHGYKPFAGEGGLDRPKQGDCNIDVICPEGDAWRRQIRSVARISVAGVGSCSAVLLNNTSHDDTPYLLTAQHCLRTAAHARSLVAYWNYESPACGILSGGTLDDSQGGAELVASWEMRTGSDFSLVVLDHAPDPEFGVYFAGWDATGSTPQGAVAIHHPGADEKAISFDHDPLTRVDHFGHGFHQWRVNQWEVGTTEGGSSGSCIFEPSTELCVGTLTAGTASCYNPDGYDIYGSFDVHWHGAGTPASRLSDWLDPGGTGQLSVGGKEPFGGAVGVDPWIIPAAASTPGVAGSDWTSEIIVVNPTNAPLTVELHYMAEGTTWPGIPLLAEPAVVAAGRSLYLDDPLAPLHPTIGMIAAVLYGDGGLVSSRTFTTGPEGSTYGQGIPAVRMDGPAADRYVLPLVHNEPGVFRTNVGIAHTSPGELTVRITAHATNGVVLGSRQVSSSGAFRQINNVFRQLGVENIAVEAAWLEVQLVGPAPAFWTCYASVVDSRTNDPTFILPVEP